MARDEREVGIDRAGDRLAWMVLSFGLLGIVAWRAFAAGESSWDLLGLVVIAGGASAAYRAWHGALTRDAVLLLALTATVAAAVAVVASTLAGS